MPDIATVLGYLSIASWLGAQFPQVLENIRNQSCEGLALPFLANWLFGDLSNLLGCILTHQLPFQTWLATYFCLVDFSLLAQYFYYGAKSRKVAGGQRRASHVRTRTGSIVHDRSAHYRTLASVAANVAAAATLAAQQEDSHPHTSSARHSAAIGGAGRAIDALSSSQVLAKERAEEDIDDDALLALTDSIHSDSGLISPSLRRHRVSWSLERQQPPSQHTTLGRRSFVPTALQITSPERTTRGRSLQRELSEQGDEIGPEGEEESATMEPAPRRTSSRASKRSAGLVFLSVWALFGVGSLNGNFPFGKGASSLSITGVARDLSNQQLANPDISYPSAHEVSYSTTLDIIAGYNSDSPSLIMINTADAFSSSSNAADDKHDDGASSERVLGRMFAWLCTTLYLTSRLPQIWKNYTRKSVEGLSVYLFIFAFLGNVFYVASILLSAEAQQPAPASTKFLKESIPYLLGSGGTLCFDITIVTQTFIYTRAARGRRGRGRSSHSVASARRKSYLERERDAGDVEEHAGLLDDEAGETTAAEQQQHVGAGVSTVVRSPSTSTMRASAAAGTGAPRT